MGGSKCKFKITLLNPLQNEDFRSRSRHAKNFTADI
jgi:hypothetical protein